MDYNYIQLCPLCRKEDKSDEIGTILIGTSKLRCMNDRYRYFETLTTINCCKECEERLKKAIGNEIKNITLDSSPVLKEYSYENYNS